jgi:hypothetical protein
VGLGVGWICGCQGYPWLYAFVSVLYFYTALYFSLANNDYYHATDPGRPFRSVIASLSARRGVGNLASNKVEANVPTTYSIYGCSFPPSNSIMLSKYSKSVCSVPTCFVKLCAQELTSLKPSVSLHITFQHHFTGTSPDTGNATISRAVHASSRESCFSLLPSKRLTPRQGYIL